MINGREYITREWQFLMEDLNSFVHDGPHKRKVTIRKGNWVRARDFGCAEYPATVQIRRYRNKRDI